MLESIQANELIREASKDKDGLILRTEALGMLPSIFTNGKEFSTGLSAREHAYLEDGLEVLVKFGYLKAITYGQIYLVTRQGYEYADSLATN